MSVDFLATSSAGDNLDWLATRKKRGRRILRYLRRNRDDEVVDHTALLEGIDAALENRSSTEREELLGLRGAEARAAASGRDESRHMQGE